MSPVRYLASVNIASTGLGAILGIVNARLLGPEAFGVIAVIGAITVTIASFVDVRLSDLAGKLYYKPPPDGVTSESYRASVLRVYVALTTLLSLVIFLLGVAAVFAFAPVFTAVPIRAGWIVAHAMAIALNHLAGAFTFQQRFSGRFYLAGTVRLVTQIVLVSAAVIIVMSNPNLDGYYTALTVSAVTSAAVTMLLSRWIWQRSGIVTSAPEERWIAAKDYRREGRFVLAGSMLGYSKMLHRGADTLLVGYFADDRVTGLYKVARSLTDFIYVLFDAINQVYYPRFMELLSGNRVKEYRAFARRLLLGGGGLTVLVLAAELLLLPSLVELTLTDRFAGAERAIILLTVPFVFVMAIHPWFWPVLVHTGKLKGFTIASFAACAAQYCVAVVLFLGPGPGPTMAAAAYIAHDLVLYPLAVWLVLRLRPEIVPLLNIEPRGERA